MTLLEVASKIGELDPELTIYAVSPWAPESPAVVTAQPEGGRGVPLEAAKNRMSYFLEVFIARDFVEDWEASQRPTPSAADRCHRLIAYATNDA